MSESSSNDVPDLGQGTDISAEDLDLSDAANQDPPATSDPEQLDDDGALGGTGGPSTGGAG